MGLPKDSGVCSSVWQEEEIEQRWSVLDQFSVLLSCILISLGVESYQ